MNVYILRWCAGGGAGGYDAASVCRSVHEALPSSSTSGGQSLADEAERAGGDAVVLLGLGVGWLCEGFVAKAELFIMDFQAAEDVHVLQLH